MPERKIRDTDLLRMRGKPTCNARNGHEGDKDPMDPEGPDVANAFGIAVLLLPLDLGGIACVIHLLNNMRKKINCRLGSPVC
jgi:hypothetical protein